MIIKMTPDELITMRVQYLVDADPLNCTAMYPIPTRAPTYGFVSTMPLATQLGTILRILGAPQRIDEAAIQVYKDGDYGTYLDLESSLAEQSEEIDGFSSCRRNSLVVRTQINVRVHAIIEKLLSAEGSDLRRALFSLKQVFQEDKDLVHAFVALGGLNCLVRVGNGADQNYQNYILRVLGQVMLYVDGMNGVMKHEPTMQWLYTLVASNYRSVVKTALKLLLVFVEYAASNCYMLVNALHFVDQSQGTLPWCNIMRLLKDYSNADAELVIYATSLINKTLAGLNDQDSFYDESDLLEQQGMESVIQHYLSKSDTDLDLLDQLQLYEAVLKVEDGESDGSRLTDNSVRKTQRNRPSTTTTQRRKSRRYSTGTSPTVKVNVLQTSQRITPTHGAVDEDSSSSTNSVEFTGCVFQEKKSHGGPGVTPGLRRRRERAERHKSFLKEQHEASGKEIVSLLENHEEVGQIVTAVPTTVLTANRYSPPAPLSLSSEQALISSDVNLCHARKTNIGDACSNSAIDSINIACLQPASHSSAIFGNSFGTSHNNTSIQYNLNINSNVMFNDTKSIGAVFLTMHNYLIERNPSVIIGIMKTIQRNSRDSCSADNAYKMKESYVNNVYQNAGRNLVAAVPNLTILPKTNDNLHYFQCNSCETFPTVFGIEVLVDRDVELKCATKTQIRTTLPSPPPPPDLIGINMQHPTTSTMIIHKSLETADTSVSTTMNVAYSASSAFFPLPQSLLPQLVSPPSLSVPQTSLPLQLTQPHHLILSQQPVEQTLGKNEFCDETQTATVGIKESENEEKKLLLHIKRDHTVKDLTQKLSNMPSSPTLDDKLPNRIIGDMSGLISKAKEGLARSKSKGEMSRSSSIDQDIKNTDQKKSESDLHWEELVRRTIRPLALCDLDFTDLNLEDEKDVLAPRWLGGGIPPPPPPFGAVPLPMIISINAGPKSVQLAPSSLLNQNCKGNENLMTCDSRSMDEVADKNTIRKNKKTVKLFWKEVREDLIPIAVGKTIWDELPDANVDTQKLEHLFESRAKDLLTKKQQDLNKSKEVIVLDHKRSNAINIAMTKLPPPRAIKAAILKMDATVVTREGIDKLLNMLPTEEERDKIQEAQMLNSELPLGSAEQFLLTLASISELGARLKLWAFRLDFDNSEKEIAEPLMDLKQGIQILRNNHTFKCVLSTLLSVGIFLNGTSVKGFQIDYLAKVPEVKDTVHKHSLLHHLCHMIIESGSDTTDLYSEIGPITRASKADFSDLAQNLVQLETECKLSWDRLKLIAKNDCAMQLKQKLVDFLADCAERIIILQTVHRRVINRYRNFLLWLGTPQHNVAESKPNEFCRILSEFALEYRTTRERVQQQIEKKANHRERNKTRGKMIIDIAKFHTKEDCADAELKELLGSRSSDTADGTLAWRRRRVENQRATPIVRQSEEHFTDGDDEILESLVKTATKTPGTRTTPRERKRTRHADRKSHTSVQAE